MYICTRSFFISNTNKFLSKAMVATASAQLNALFRFNNSLPFKAKFVLVQSFVYMQSSIIIR